MNGSKNLKKIILLCALFFLFAAIVFSGLHILESTVFNSEEEEQPSGTQELENEETGYFPRQDITTVLLMGIDEEGPVKASEGTTNSAFVDVVALVIFDETNEKIDVININRDTMVEMTSLDENGKRNGIYYGQLSFAHTFGTGLEDSCENTVRTVSDLLNGARIDYYASVNMGAVPIANDFVGGVTVNVTDDFSAIDHSITMGECTLWGDSALTFVRSRKNLGDGLNLSRMERQKEYAYGFINSLKAKFESEGHRFSLSLLDSVNEYLVTDLSAETLLSMSERYKDYEIGDIITPKGENVQGTMYYEFYVDEEDLERIVLDMLYIEK